MHTLALELSVHQEIKRLPGTYYLEAIERISSKVSLFTGGPPAYGDIPGNSGATLVQP